MEWIDVNNEEKQIPFTKLCIWDGGNTFWAYLLEIKTTSNGRQLKWNVITHEGYGECIPLKWIKIEHPN